MLGYWRVFDYWWVTVIAALGGVLGVLFTIPLRRALIVEQQLAFPEGTATAEVLKVGEQPGRGALQLAFAALLGAAVKFARDGLPPVARHGSRRDATSAAARSLTSARTCRRRCSASATSSA